MKTFVVIAVIAFLCFIVITTLVHSPTDDSDWLEAGEFIKNELKKLENSEKS